MSRWVSGTNETEAAKASVIITVLADLDFAGGHIRVHDGIGTVSHGGHDYLGVGRFGGIDLDPEDQEIAAKGARLTLSGVPADMTPDVFAETNYQGRAATLYVGLVNPDTNAWVDDPEILWAGLMDYMDVQYGEGDARIVLHVEDELRREPIQAWNTDEDQQIRFPGDRFFSDLQNVAIFRAMWGQRPVGMGGVIAPGGSGGGGSDVLSREQD